MSVDTAVAARESAATSTEPSSGREIVPGRSLSGEKAQRIIDAMRHSVARRGSAGSTFDHVSREAGVSRGLLHYYFGTKEQLLVEAVRRDCELRLERLESQLSTAQTADDFIGLMAAEPAGDRRRGTRFRHARVRAVHAFAPQRRHRRRVRGPDAPHARARREMLAAAEREGVLRLHAEPEAVAEILFSLGDGVALRMLSEPDRDFTGTIEAGIVCVRALLTD